MMLRGTMSCPAWSALPSCAQALYVWIKFEWRGPSANNNGKIRLSLRQAATAMGCNIKTAGRAFHELRAKGFLVVTEGARLGLSGEARSPAFEITEIGMPGTERLGERGGRKLYLKWQPGSDFPVTKTMTNNPSGRNGKTKPCAHFGDRIVPIKGTKS